MRLSCNYEANLFSFASFIDKIPLSRQHMGKLSYIKNISYKTFLKNIFPRRGASLSKDYNQVN